MAVFGADPVALAMRLIEVDEGALLFVTGEPGTGKSHTAREVIRQLRDSGRRVLAVAPTGVAATVLGGATIHRALGLVVSENGAGGRALAGQLDWARQCEATRCDVLVVDEISMVSGDMLDVIDAKMRALRERHEAPFGGAAVILVGDLAQLPPVSRGPPARTVATAAVWPAFATLLLRKQHRVDNPEDATLVRMLRGVRGAIDCTDDVHDFVRAAAARSRSRSRQEEEGDRVWLCDTNGEVDRRNAAELGGARERWAQPAVLLYTGPPNLAQQAELAQTVQKEVDGEFAVGAPVVFIANIALLPLLSAWEGLLSARERADQRTATHWPTVPDADPQRVIEWARQSRPVDNGTRGVVHGSVRAFGNKRLPVVRVGQDLIVALPHFWALRACKHVDDDDAHTNAPGTSCWTAAWAVPLRLAWATTIHKAQGSTVPRGTSVVVTQSGGRDAQTKLYVALSRARAIDQIDLSDWDADALLRRIGTHVGAPYKEQWAQLLEEAHRLAPDAGPEDAVLLPPSLRLREGACPCPCPCPNDRRVRALAAAIPARGAKRRRVVPSVSPEADAWIRARVTNIVSACATDEAAEQNALEKICLVLQDLRETK